ncbi:MAG TPA: hypothetical protein PLU27_00775 [Ginsengibacter sp.]|nr:hypothetical protein [Ginsengibacter sp.]HRP43277.1 hypothetical protein [Ginsengibacter sp.]
MKSFSHYIKKRKIRLLPGVFYLRWELELLSAFVLIAVLAKVPEWTRFSTLSFTEERATLVTYGIFVFCDMLIAALAVYICMRLLWLCLITFRQVTNSDKLVFTRQIDQIAEILISICIVLLVIAFLTYMFALLLGYLQNEMTNKIVRPSQMNF